MAFCKEETNHKERDLKKKLVKCARMLAEVSKVTLGEEKKRLINGARVHYRSLGWRDKV